MTTTVATSTHHAGSLLSGLSQLHGAFSEHEFFERLHSVLAGVLGIRDITIVGVSGDAASVLHSSVIPELRNQMRQPAVSHEEVMDLFRCAAERPAVGACLEGRSVRIEGTAHPVLNIWQLGGAAAAGYVLFHDAPNESAASELDAAAAQLHAHASVAYEKLADRARAEERAALLQAKLHAITEAGELIGCTDVDVLLTKLIELALYIVSAEGGSVIIVGDGKLQNQVEWGFTLDMARCFQDSEGRVVYECVIESREPLLISDFASSAYRIVGCDLHVKSYLCIPLVSKERCLGVINLLSSGAEGRSEGFSSLDKEILVTISGLAATTIENALLYADSLEKQRYQQGLAIARDIQRRMYPSTAPEIEGLDIAWLSQSCDETGGDYFDFIARDDKELTVVIGDVSGHGIGAALLMASARAGMRAILTQGQRPADILRHLNMQLERDMELERFMTLFVAAFDLRAGRIRYVNAGHDAPCLFRAATDCVDELESTGVPLGIFPGSTYATRELAALAPGDVMLLTTDGVWEVKGPSGELLGKQRLMEIFRKHARAGGAEAIAKAILADVADYTANAPPRDDVSLVIVRAVQ
ncbi:MAG: SpoIIE family protein phosphatase [Planctomycetes bacterium]|nr:SpoIIE family protein phosphatase [Planctomycetota bacterium]